MSLINKHHVLLRYIMLFAALIMVGTWQMIYGSGHFIDIRSLQLGSSSTDNSEAYIVYYLRAPRLAAAMIAGSALAAAGVIAQGLFRNPLASPSLIGASSGATAFAAIAFYFEQSYSFNTPLFALVGSLCPTLLLLGLAQSRLGYHMTTVILAGVAMSAFLSALTSLFISLAASQFDKLSTLMHWLLGSLAYRNWQHVYFSLPLWCVGFFLMWWCAPALDTLHLGEEVSQTLGVSIKRLKLISIVSMAALCSAAITAAGPLAFIGLIVPHLARSLFGYLTTRSLLGTSAALGAILVISADQLAQNILQGKELEVGIITNLLGAGFFVYLLLMHASSWQNNER